MTERIRVLIADDQVLLRGSLRMLLESVPDIEVVGEAGTGGEVLKLLLRQVPDVILMDVQMPDMDGIEATRQVCASRESSARVLVLTTFDMDEYVYGALRAGASGFILKDTPPADLLAAIRVVAGGDALISPVVTRRLIAEFVRHPGPATASARGRALPGVTEREREVLLHVARGLSNTEIARQLQVSLATVKTHIGSLLAKLGARDRAQLVITAYEAGLVEANFRKHG
ncbi:response regulator transcription factor [Streptosporangium sp. NPDC006930]|uniref:response regulator transcription factor n=1 Tax=unclassified Streptosporangium TaxID=2632669 RepID=UPI0034189085